MKQLNLDFRGKNKRNSIIRTGIPSLDEIFAGGIPLGTIIVVEETLNNDFSHILSKSFLGEGAVTHDYLFIYSEQENERSIPNIRRIGNSSVRGDSTVRYETFGANSDVQEPYVIDLSSINNNYKNLIQATLPSLNEDFYHKLWVQIRNDLQSSYENKEILNRRVLIKSMFSMNWPQKSFWEIFEFFKSIKTLLRSRNAVCMISIPFSFLEDNLKNIVFSNSDFILLSNQGDSTNPVQFQIYKAPKAITVEPNSSYTILQKEGTTLIQKN
jgi:archaellum biogenesis ATPase FlaH